VYGLRAYRDTLQICLNGPDNDDNDDNVDDIDNNYHKNNLKIMQFAH